MITLQLLLYDEPHISRHFPLKRSNLLERHRVMLPWLWEQDNGTFDIPDKCINASWRGVKTGNRTKQRLSKVSRREILMRANYCQLDILILDSG